MDYEKLVDVAMNVGEVILKHGAETYRVEDTMRRILSIVDSEYRDAYVIYTGVVVTLTPHGSSAITKVMRIENKGSNYNKIYLANNLSRKLCDGKITVEEAEKELHRIRESRVFPSWMIAISTVMVTSSPHVRLFQLPRAKRNNRYRRRFGQLLSLKIYKESYHSMEINITYLNLMQKCPSR